MPRKTRVDSTAAAVAILKGAQREIAPPGHVRFDENDWPFWHSIIAELPRSEWTDHKLEMAALLARTMAHWEAEQYKLRVEGSTQFNEKGTMVPNPREAIVQKQASIILAMRRSMQIHERGLNASDPEGIGKRRGHARQIERAAAHSFDDDLI